MIVDPNLEADHASDLPQPGLLAGCRQRNPWWRRNRIDQEFNDPIRHTTGGWRELQWIRPGSALSVCAFRQRSEIDPRKLTDYLLSPDHPTGREKARFFAAIGYTTADAERLAAALLRIAEYERVIRFVQSDFGTTFVVDGTIKSATGSLIGLRTVWFLDRAGGRPRFVTAYPV